MRLVHLEPVKSKSFPAGPAFQIEVGEPVPAPTEKMSGALPAWSCVASSVFPVIPSTYCGLITMFGYLCSKSAIVFVHAFWTVFGYIIVSVTVSLLAALAAVAATTATITASTATSGPTTRSFPFLILSLLYQ